MGQNDSTYVRTTLNQELNDKFKTLKEHLGLRSDAEVLRFLVKDAYDRFIIPPLNQESIGALHQIERT